MKGTPGHLPPIVLVGAAGAGKQTVAELLKELAGYALDAPGSAVYGRNIAIPEHDYEVSGLRGAGFRVVWVYAPPVYRGTRLLASGRMQPGDDIPDDHGTTDVDYTLSNIGTVDELRSDIADMLNRMAS